MKLVECVPNFSEGRDEQVIASIAQASGDAVLHVDPNPDAHRTVMTLAGEPEAVVESAFRAASRAAEVIDMTRHQGAHPRLGAIDVCPLVPLAGVTLDECAHLARNLGRRIGEELGIPVYFYGAAAMAPERRRLAWVRRGGYEGLSLRLEDPKFKPDFGPKEFNPRSGATVVGARNILIAFNVNLDSDDLTAAEQIARSIRTAGSPARLPECQALGWLMPGYGRAQVSLNLTDYRVTPLHVAYETVKREAGRRDRAVTGGELVGMVPVEALLAAGRHYLPPDRTAAEVGLEELLATAIDGLGLASVRPFVPQEQVLELRLAQTEGAAAAWARETIDRLSNAGGRDDMNL
ncbi:MAG: glutamate formimidoyltransferase [Candidatus Neomarinimicrobiota bacterium]